MVLSDSQRISSLVERGAILQKKSSEDAPSTPTSKQLAFEIDKSQILRLCKERISLTSPVFISWENVKRFDIISPSVLSLVVLVHRYFGEDDHGIEIYREVELEVFVVECPADDLCRLLGDRMKLFPMRRDLRVLLSTGSMNGDASNVDYSKSSGVIVHDSGTVTSPELSLGSRIIEKLYMTSIEIELVLKELEEALLTLEDPEVKSAARAEISHHSRLLGRVKLYIATLLSASLFGPSYDEDDIKQVIAADRKEAQRLFESGTDDQMAKNTVSFLLDMAELRVRDYALCGWSHQGNLLESCLKTIINGYYINIVEALGYFFDSKDALESLKGNESKLMLIEFVIENDNRFNLIVQNSLLPYNLCVSPAPLLSLSLNITALMRWYSELLRDEMRVYVKRVFEVARTSANPNSPGLYHIPWEITRSEGGVLVSSMPYDTESLLKSYFSLSTSRFSSRFTSLHVKSNVTGIEKNVHLFYAECMSLLVELYYEFLSGHDWTTPMPLPGKAKYDEDVEFQAMGDHLDWLSSVANDCVRISNRLQEELGDVRRGKGGDDSRRGLEMENCSKLVSRTSRLSLEFMSCIIFKSFDDVVPTSNIYRGWLGQSDMVDKFVEGGMWYLSTQFETLERSCHGALLEICLKKVIVWYLYFINECANNSSIKLTQDDFCRIERDVKVIVDAFSAQEKYISRQDGGDGESRTSHALLRFQRIIILLTEPIGSVEYTGAICNILDDLNKFPAEGKAMSACVRAICKIRERAQDYNPNEVNEFGIYPREYIRTMTSQMEEATKEITENVALFSLGAYILVFDSHISAADYFIHSATQVMTI